MANISRQFKNRENGDEIFNEIRQTLDSSLLQLINGLEEFDIPYCLDSGTLLGAYRNGESLTADSDHDIVVKIEDLMTENGKAYLRKYAPNYRRSHHMTRTPDKMKIETFTSAEIMLARIESGKPFIITNMGWEALYDGKPHKFTQYQKRGPQKIDVFIKYPWNAVIGNEIFPEAKDHHVYPLPFYSEYFCRIPSWQVDESKLATVKSTVNTLDGKVTRDFKTYSNIEEYLESLYGDWKTPTGKYSWHTTSKYLPTKIKTAALKNEEITNYVQIQDTYLFDPTKI